MNKQVDGNDLTIAQSCHEVDEPFQITWANTTFYQLFSNQHPPTSLKDMIQDTQSFSTLYQSVIDYCEGRCASITCDARLGLDKRWYRMQGSLLSSKQIIFAYIDIDDLKCSINTEKQKSKHDKQAFEWMLSEYTGNVYISDMKTYELLYLNKESCRVLQAKQEDLIGRKCYEVIQGRTSPCPFCNNAELKENEVYEWEFYNPNLEQTFMIKDKIIDWNGHRARIELSHDMLSTEYRLAKKDREREAIIKTIPGGFARVDARDKRTILWYGGEFLSMIGYTKEQFETELHAQCTYVHPEDLIQASEIMDKIIETGEDIISEGRIITRDGTIKILTITYSYVSGENSWDGIPSFYSVGIDITKERHEQERQRIALEEAYEISRVSSQAKSNFLSSMSHDIRTPMNAIMGMSTIAQANIDKPEKIASCLNKIQRSGRHLLSLINEVLDMSKIESGKIDLMSENVDLSELIQTVCDLSKPLIAEKHQELNVIVEKVIHEKIIADGDRLEQIFINILSNAVKYTPEYGHIMLRITELPSTSPDKGIFEFTFQDDGIGIAQDYIPHLFEPFSRAEDDRISKIQGTGLGLAITDNIIRMMNGTIEVHSELGKGSQFIVTIPMVYQEKEEEQEEKLYGLSVLVADDDPIVCENAVLLLNELGMQGEWVLNGQDAISKIKEAHILQKDYFAVILDWKMPGMDGLDTVRVIRNQLGETVPIIIISAYDLSDIEDDFIAAGADAFISKPLFKSKMLHVLGLFCDKVTQDNAANAIEVPVYPMQGKRILLVEDNELNREIAAEILAMQGIIVETAENGEVAVSMVQNAQPGYYSAILMDVQMPIMNGYEAARAIRKLPQKELADIPIIALSANVFVSDIKESLEAGMNDHIAKPIDINVLKEKLSNYVKQ